MRYGARGSGNRRFAACVVGFAALLLASSAWGGGLHDPTRPDFGAPVKARHARRFHLDATLISGRRRVAIINGKTAGVGERVKGAKVVAIRPGRVELETGRGRVVLKLIADNVKTARAARRRQQAQP
jgi:hypothetical protein